MSANGTNGVNAHRLARSLKPGIYAPIPTFFLPDTEDLGKFSSLIPYLYKNTDLIFRYPFFRIACSTHR